MSTRTQQQVETVTRIRSSAGPAEERGSDTRYGTGRPERKASSVPLTLGLLFDDATDFDLDFD